MPTTQDAVVQEAEVSWETEVTEVSDEAEETETAALQTIPYLNAV